LSWSSESVAHSLGGCPDLFSRWYDGRLIQYSLPTSRVFLFCTSQLERLSSEGDLSSAKIPVYLAVAHELACEHDLGDMSRDESADFDRDVAHPCWDGDPSEYQNLHPVGCGTGHDGRMNN